jgi:hypothetical protein
MAGTFIQGGSSAPSGTQASISQAYAQSQSNGNLNFLFFWTPASTTPTVSDTAGNIYTPIVSNLSISTQFISAYFSAGIQGCGAGNLVTVQFAPSVATPRLAIGEWSGVALGAIDINGTATATSTAPSVSATTTNATDLLISCGLCSPGNFTGAGAGFTSRLTLGGSFIMEDGNVSSAGAQTATMTVSASTTWQLLLVAFRQAAAGQPITVPEIVTLNSFGVSRVGLV